MYDPEGDLLAGDPPEGNDGEAAGAGGTPDLKLDDGVVGLGVAPVPKVGDPIAGLGVTPAPKVGEGVGEGVAPGSRFGDTPVPKGSEALGLGDPPAPKVGVGKIGVEDRGGVGTTSVGLGEGIVAIAGCSVGVGFGLTAGASAVWIGVLRLSSCTPAAVAPATNTSPAAVFAQTGVPISLAAKPFLWAPLRLGNTTNSSAYCSKAVARSNNCSVLRRTTCPDSGVAREPR